MPGMNVSETIRTYTPGRVAPKPSERIILPLRPEEKASFEADLFDRFIHHLRHVPNSRMEIKILSAIQFTADSIDHGDALVAKTLVDLGLRAPRKAFPVAFLDFADRSIARQGWDIGSYTPLSVMELKYHWDKIGEDMFSSFVHIGYAVQTVHAAMF